MRIWFYKKPDVGFFCFIRQKPNLAKSMNFFTIKKDQTHAFDANGKRLFITRLIARPLTITAKKTQKIDGYDSYQVAIGSKKNIKKPISGHLKKLEIKPQFLKEIKNLENKKNIGEQIKVTDIFNLGDKIAVRAKTKGRGFAGVIKRWGFHGGPRTHGQTDRQRAPGSIGQGTDPGRVHKGKKMPGRMGGVYKYIKGGKIIKIDEENNQLWITGTVPGPKGGLVEIIRLRPGKFAGLYQKKSEKNKPSENQTDKKEEKNSK